MEWPVIILELPDTADPAFLETAGQQAYFKESDKIVGGENYV